MTRRLLLYLAVVGASVLAVAGLIQLGDTWFTSNQLQTAATPAAGAGVVSQVLANSEHALSRLLIQLVVIVVAARAVAMLAASVGQPPVIGEIAAGVLLGPSLLGWLAPGASAFLFPVSSMPTLQLLSQIGVLLFMFVIGLELDPAALRGRAHVAAAVSHFSIVVPFVLGVALALGLYSAYAPPGVPFNAFALFCGVAMSITAFPVLARILDERRLTHTPLGATALTCAALGDVAAWTILAVVVAVTTAANAASLLLAMLTLAAAFGVLMLVVVRPLLHRVLHVHRPSDALGRGHIAVIVAVLLGSALATELIGIHALFGAFLAGTIMPTDGTLRRMLRERLESVSAVFLLPLFFAFTGLRTEIGLLDSLTSWAVCLGIIVVATVGKLGGTAIAARWTGSPWREAAALGALMNTRGLMELIALNVGYDLGILTPEIFTMMVIMALVTTAMASPLLSLSLGRGWQRASRLAGPMVPSS
jgi:Kef-type K+ transport system membrane component KefB